MSTTEIRDPDRLIFITFRAPSSTHRRFKLAATLSGESLQTFLTKAAESRISSSPEVARVLGEVEEGGA